MNESQVQKVFINTKNPRNSKIYSDEGFVNVDNGSMGGLHWTCFIVKDNKSFYFDSFGSQAILFPLKQLPKPIIYHNFKIQNINS